MKHTLVGGTGTKLLADQARIHAKRRPVCAMLRRSRQPANAILYLFISLEPLNEVEHGNAASRRGDVCNTGICCPRRPVWVRRRIRRTNCASGSVASSPYGPSPLRDRPLRLLSFPIRASSDGIVLGTDHRDARGRRTHSPSRLSFPPRRVRSYSSLMRGVTIHFESVQVSYGSGHGGIDSCVVSGLYGFAKCRGPEGCLVIPESGLCR